MYSDKMLILNAAPYLSSLGPRPELCDVPAEQNRGLLWGSSVGLGWGWECWGWGSHRGEGAQILL